jgi:phosphoglycerol transferase MdoB-like AlkP superfamily enzyme
MARPALQSATFLVVLHLIYSLVLRVAAYVDLARADLLTGQILGPPLSLPFLLGEELVLAVIAGAILAAVHRIRALRVAWIAVYGCYLIFLAAEQLMFEHYFTHLDYALYSESTDVAAMSSSIVDMMDAQFFVELALALAAVVLLARSWRPGPISALAGLAARRPLAVVIAAAAYLGLTVVLVATAEQHGLDRPFPAAFVESYMELEAEEEAVELAVNGPASLPEAASQGGTTSNVEVPPKPPAKADGTSDELAGVRAAIAKREKPLNVVIYLMESASFHETSLEPQNRYDTTPFLADLAQRSLVFGNYYSGVAASARTFFSLLTGLRPYLDKTSDLTRYSQIEVPTLVDVLHDEGYQTGFFTSSFSRFDSLDSFLLNRPYDAYMDAALLPKHKRKRQFLGYWGVDEELVIDEALAWIERAVADKRPFLVNYNAVFPHHPYEVPPKHKRLTKQGWGGPPRHARYRASLAYADLALKRFHDGLERMGLLADTLFVVTADHGEAFGDRHPGNLLHAGFAYDDDQRVFLVMHNESTLGPPLQNDRLGSHTDVLPTLLQALGIERELQIEGQSLIASDFRPPMVFTYSRRQLAVRDGDLKLIVSRKRGRSQLYDLTADPLERNDLAAERPQVVEKYEKIIKQWRAETKRSYAQRIAATGLSPKQTRKLVKAKRKELKERGKQ